jgi:DNA-binding beta-propeller fold protein YncE
MRHAYSVVSSCVCAALLAGCSANNNVYPAIPASPTLAHSRAQVSKNISREFVYVANQGSGNVSAYAVRSGGALEEVAGSPFAAGNGSGGIGIDQPGKSVYVSNQNYPSPTHRLDLCVQDQSLKRCVDNCAGFAIRGGQ